LKSLVFDFKSDARDVRFEKEDKNWISEYKKDNAWGQWCAAASGLKPFRLPHAQMEFKHPRTGNINISSNQPCPFPPNYSAKVAGWRVAAPGPKLIRCRAPMVVLVNKTKQTEL